MVEFREIIQPIISFINDDCKRNNKHGYFWGTDTKEAHDLALTALSAYILIREGNFESASSNDYYEYVCGNIPRFYYFAKTIDYNKVKCGELKFAGKPNAFYYAEEVRLTGDDIRKYLISINYISEINNKKGFLKLLEKIYQQEKADKRSGIV